MLNLLHSISMGSGALIIGLCSALLAVFLARIPKPALRWVLLLAMPYVFAHSLYWAPVWLGAHPSEYSAWALAVVGFWYIVGAILSVFVAKIILKSKRS